MSTVKNLPLSVRGQKAVGASIYLEPREKLELARRLVEQVTDTLNDKASICACCGLNKRENFAESMAKDSLVAVVNKLRGIIFGDAFNLKVTE